MRKRMKNKRRSCALCKPHKRGHENRWTARDEDRLRRFERERRVWVGCDSQRDERACGTA